MPNLLFYAIIAALTIASPGPGALLTLTNTLNYRFNRALYGIAGVAVGMAVIGIIASSSVGVLLTTSPHALTAIKIIGGAYLFYLGTKLFKSKPKTLNEDGTPAVLPSAQKLFSQAFFITLFNPKPIVFFMALFPQFVNQHQPVIPQFALLIAIFCALIIVIHCLYAYFASVVRNKLTGDNFFVSLNRIAGIVFMVFGAVLALSIIR